MCPPKFAASLIPNTQHQEHPETTASEQLACFKQKVCCLLLPGSLLLHGFTSMVESYQNSDRIADLPRHGCPRVTTLHQDQHIILLHLRNRLLLAIVAAGNILGCAESVALPWGEGFKRMSFMNDIHYETSTTASPLCCSSCVGEAAHLLHHCLLEMYAVHQQIKLPAVPSWWSSACLTLM